MIYEPQSWLEHFFIFSDYPINAERGHYVLSLVFLSFLIASIGAFTSLKVIQVMLMEEKKNLKTRLHWVGAICLSATIWSMHFVGMLAYDMDMLHSYNLPLTFLSMLIAAAVAYSFIAIIRFRQPNVITYCLGAFSLGLAICLMHYSGMLAMEMDAKLLYLPIPFTISVLIAFTASAIAMWLVYKLRQNQSVYFLAFSSIVISVGICGLHYTGMLATVFLPYADCRFATEQTYTFLAFIVTAISALVYISSYLLAKRKLHNNTSDIKNNWSDFIPALFFIAGISIVTLSVVMTEGSLKRQAAQRFLSLANEIEDGILDKYQLYEQALYGGLGLYEASNYVSQKEWKQFISIQDIKEKLNGINGIGFIKYLETDELSTFSEKYKNETGEVFRIHPETPHNNKFVIKYIEPMAINKEAVGLDIGFEKNRREAAERSLKTGLPALTKKIELVQDNKARAGFLLLMPFFKYQQQQDPSTAPQKEIYGWVYAPFIGENFLKDLASLSNEEVTFAVYDGEIIDDKYLIYKDAKFNDVLSNKQLSHTTTITIAGQTWSVIFKSTSIFTAAVKSYLPILQMVLGLVITALLSAISYNQNTRERTIKKLVAVKTQELQDLSDGLEQTVQERTSALEKASQAKDVFLANMSHELRTPLNSILGLIKMLLDENDIPNEHRQTLQTVDKASSSLLSIVNDVLDISKIEAEMIELEEYPFELNSFMASLTEQLKPIASQKGLILKDNIEELPTTIVASDKLRLSRIILNLGSNAIKYTLTGDVNINTHIKSHTNDQFITFECSVTDTGIGIPEDKIEHIFEKFTQAEESTERKFGGTGLGLNITKQLVELMDGTITVKSVLNEGSTFTINIPLKLSNAAAMKANKEANENAPYVEIKNTDKKPAKHAKILIAEDHEFNQIFILKLLKQFGFEDILLVTDGRQALENFKKHAYDIVLMDCHMPKLDGYDATRQIRDYEKEMDNNQHVPICAMTADAMIGTKENCLKAGMDKYITKPIDSNILKKYLGAFFTIDTKQQKNTGGEPMPLEKQKELSPKALLDINILLEYADNDMEEVKELIALFHESSSNDLQTLQNNITDGENEEWSETAHRLKGGAAYIGAETLRVMCENAQNMKTATKKEREEQYAKIETCHKEICEHLKNEELL